MHLDSTVIALDEAPPLDDPIAQDLLEELLPGDEPDHLDTILGDEADAEANADSAATKDDNIEINLVEENRSLSVNNPSIQN